jgi:hypothetical protein
MKWAAIERVLKTQWTEKLEQRAENVADGGKA